MRSWSSHRIASRTIWFGTALAATIFLMPNVANAKSNNGNGNGSKSSGSSSSSGSGSTSGSSSSSTGSTTSTTTSGSSGSSSTSTTPSNSASQQPTASYSFSAIVGPQYGSTENTGASANLTFSFLQFGNTLRLDLGIKNTTNGSSGLGATQATLVGLAFDAPSIFNLTSANYSANGSSLSQFWVNPTINANGFGTYSYGISTPRNVFDGGNPAGGLTAGQSTTVSFDLSSLGLTAKDASTQFANFLSSSSNGGIAARFQQVNAGGGSDKVKGKLQIQVIPPAPKKVPEPAMGLGLLAVGATMALRRKAIAARNA